MSAAPFLAPLAVEARKLNRSLAALLAVAAPALIEADIAVFAIGPRARTLEGIYREVSAPSPPQPLMQPELV